MVLNNAKLCCLASSSTSLFQLVDWYGLITERKLQASQLPHHLYIQNYSTASETCLCVRKFLFSPGAELSLAADELAMRYVFWSAVDAVDRGHIRADNRLYQLKALQDSSRKNEVILG